MKRQLIYHTHVSPNAQQNTPVPVISRIVDEHNETLDLTCSMDRISRDGMTLSCDKLTLSLLMPNKAGLAPKNPLKLETEFCLGAEIKARGRVMYTRRLSKNEFLLELKFCDMSEQDTQLIDQFIENSLNGVQADSRNLAVHSKPVDAPAEKSRQTASLRKLTASEKPLFSKVA